MDSFKDVPSTIFAQRFNGAGRTPEVISRFFKLAVASTANGTVLLVFCVALKINDFLPRPRDVRSNCFSFVCPVALLSLVHSAGQIFHRLFHSSAMKISFARRQFSLNPQTPLDRIRQLYIVL